MMRTLWGCRKAILRCARDYGEKGGARRTVERIDIIVMFRPLHDGFWKKEGPLAVLDHR
jgi:hypothetical protein